MIELDALIDDAQAAAAREAQAQADRAAKAEADNLREDRKRAVKAASQALEVDTDPGDWHRLELTEDEAASGRVSRTVWLEVDTVGDDVRLAFRHRGVTAGGDVLTVLAEAPESGEWVAARTQIERLADLPAVVDDARRSAELWDAQVAAFEDGDGPDPIEPGPTFTIAGDTAAEILARAVLLVIDEA